MMLRSFKYRVCYLYIYFILEFLVNIDVLLIIRYNDIYDIKLIDHEKKLYGFGFGQNSKPVTGMGFLMGLNIFHGFGFGDGKTRWV